MNGGLLVAYQDVLEFVLLEDGVVDVEDGSARIAEDVFHALFRQATHDNFCARDWTDASLFMKHSFQGPLGD
jgi:hypothetical protein